MCFFDKPCIIRCYRPVNQIAESMSRCYGWTYERAVDLIEERELYLDRMLIKKDVINIYFDYLKTDEEIILELEDKS